MSAASVPLWPIRVAAAKNAAHFPNVRSTGPVFPPDAPHLPGWKLGQTRLTATSTTCADHGEDVRLVFGFASRAVEKPALERAAVRWWPPPSPRRVMWVAFCSPFLQTLSARAA